LNFSHPFETNEESLMPWNRLVAARLLTAAMFASLVGGLLTSNQWDFGVKPLDVEAARGTQASPEMMRLLQNEHDLVAQMVKAQLATSRSRFDANPIGATGRDQAIAMH
jgi:hypothetical protein